jgi:hypothetical protein
VSVSLGGSGCAITENSPKQCTRTHTEMQRQRAPIASQMFSALDYVCIDPEHD